MVARGAGLVPDPGGARCSGEPRGSVEASLRTEVDSARCPVALAPKAQRWPWRPDAKRRAVEMSLGVT